MEDERHFNFYDSKKRLPNQVVLLKKLEDLGYEKKGKYILTTECIGIPVTSMLLLVQESLNVVSTTQSEFDKNELTKTVCTLKGDELLNEITGLKYSDPNFQYSSLNFYKQTVWDTDPSPSISGSVMAYQSYIYKADLSTSPKIDQIYDYPGSNYFLYNSLIRDVTSRFNETNLIQLYKNIILFIELSYAIQQRVKVEQRLFEDLKKSKIIKLQSGNNFTSVCGIRGGYIHGGSFKLQILPETSKILIGNSPVELSMKFEKSFIEAIEWINNIYAEMISKL